MARGLCGWLNDVKLDEDSAIEKEENDNLPEQTFEEIKNSKGGCLHYEVH